jgi:hypothetical protein
MHRSSSGAFSGRRSYFLSIPVDSRAGQSCNNSFQQKRLRTTVFKRANNQLFAPKIAVVTKTQKILKINLTSALPRFIVNSQTSGHSKLATHSRFLAHRPAPIAQRFAFFFVGRYGILGFRTSLKHLQQDVGVARQDIGVFSSFLTGRPPWRPAS